MSPCGAPERVSKGGIFVVLSINHCHNEFMKSSLIRTGIVASISLCFFLTACGKTPVVELPTGLQTLSGSLSAVELSLTRRGTHILRQHGDDLYYVESSTVNLREFEGMDVLLKGMLQKNTEDTDLPVLVADNIRLIEEPSHVWTVNVLSMKLSAPLTWNASLFSDGIRFTATGSPISLVKLVRSSLEQLPSGTPLVVGGKQAVRLDTASGQVIYVQNAKDIIAISIDSSLSGAKGKQPAQSVVRLLTSIVFTNAPSGSGSYASQSGSAPSGGMACGGVAGILCPSGSFCNITDKASGIGVCMFLQP